MLPPDDVGIIATKSSQLKGNLHDFKIVTYKAHRKNKTQKNIQEENPGSVVPSELDMKKTRFELYKFSKSDLNFSNRQKSNVDLAIQLGAKPKKNESKNYKQLKAERLIERQQKEEERLFKQMSSNFKNKMASKSKSHPKMSSAKHKSKEGILELYGKVK